MIFSCFYAAKHLRLPYLSAYLDSIGTSFRHGANFATGGARIRRFNTSFFVTGESPFSLDIQIVQFDQFKARTSNLYNHGNIKYHLKRNCFSAIFVSFIFFVGNMQPRNTPTEEISQGLRTSQRLFIHLTLGRMILPLAFKQ
jgi:hypothetical protein